MVRMIHLSQHAPNFPGLKAQSPASQEPPQPQANRRPVVILFLPPDNGVPGPQRMGLPQ